jgi:exopolyphosphatase/guanosine-5'-triphosphate,3'-diphosphate pyrophosphatase
MTTPRTAHIVMGDDRTVITVHGEDDTTSSIELPIGGTDIQRRHLSNDPPLPEQLTNAIGEVLDHLEDAKRELEALLDATAVRVSGAVPMVIAAVEVGAPIDADEFVLTRDAAEDVFRTLATETHDERRHNPGLPLEHVPTVVGGCCVVVAVLRGLHLDAVTVTGPGHEAEIGEIR